MNCALKKKTSKQTYNKNFKVIKHVLILFFKDLSKNTN